MDEDRLSIEDEKYLCKLNKMNAFDLFKTQKKEELKMEEANDHGDFILFKIMERQYQMIEYVILNRMHNN
jgi:vacuolar-type H+-ATPase subunit B/Vma2